MKAHSVKILKETDKGLEIRVYFEKGKMDWYFIDIVINKEDIESTRRLFNGIYPRPT